MKEKELRRKIEIEKDMRDSKGIYIMFVVVAFLFLLGDRKLDLIETAIILLFFAIILRISIVHNEIKLGFMEAKR